MQGRREGGGQGGSLPGDPAGQGARPVRPRQLFHDSLFIECTSMTADSNQSPRPPRNLAGLGLK